MRRRRLDRGPQRGPRIVRLDDGLHQSHQPQQLAAEQVEVSTGLGLVLQRLVEAEQGDRRCVRVDLEPGLVDHQPEPLADAGTAGALGELRLAGVGRMGAGLEAAEVAAERLLGRAGAGRRW